MLSSTIILLLASIPALLAAPAPGPFVRPAGLTLTVYQKADCKGPSHVRHNIKHNDNFEDSPASKSYRLSKDLAAHDYLTFGSMRPFVAEGDARKKGCHNLKDEAFYFMFQEVKQTQD
ncbi:MAG: hypothetical protein Q9222_005130 [Ikaeria aurantiellina]